MLDEDEVIMVGRAVFDNALREMKQGGFTKRWLPAYYQCDDIRFRIFVYLNMTDEHDPDGLVFTMDRPIDLTHEITQDIVQVAFWLYNQIAALNLVLMFVGNHGLDSICGETSEEIKRYQGRVYDLRLLDLYPALPNEIKEQIVDAITTCKHAYEEALRREAAERNRLWWEAFRNNPKHGYIYLLQSVSGAYKIGRSKDPDDRLRTFEVKLPFEVEYVCTVETANMYELERALHKQFDHKRINGEWFRLEDKDIAAIKALAEIKPPPGVQLW